MGALADFAQGFFQNRADAAQRQELARDEMSAYERKLRLEQKLQQELEKTKVARSVPDLERRVMINLNSNNEEIGTRPMSQAEYQSYSNATKKEEADVRGALARADVDERQARDYDENQRLARESQRLQMDTTRQYAANAAAANRRAEAEFQDNAGAFGPPRNRAGGALAMPKEQQRVLENDAMFDVLLREVGSADEAKAVAYASERARIEQEETDPVRRAAAIRRLVERLKAEASGGSSDPNKFER